MRKNKRVAEQSDFTILLLDDEPIMTETLQTELVNNGYRVDTSNDPDKAIEIVKKGSYDILILDYMMPGKKGDEVVEEIRLFNQELFIILLTGHKDMVPPIQTIRTLDIQGYCEKGGDSFNELELLVESCAKSVRQMRTIRKYQKGLTEMAEEMPSISRMHNPEEICRRAADIASTLWGGNGALVALDPSEPDGGSPIRVEVGRSFDVNLDGKLETVEQKIREKAENEEIFFGWMTDSAGKNFGLMAVRTPNADDAYDSRRFSIFVRQCGAAAENAFLTQRVKDGYMELIGSIRTMVDARDQTTYGHSNRVSILAVKIAKRMGCSAEMTETIRLAGLFHDIGKVSVPDSILNSNGKLNNEEYSEIKNHSQKGAEMLSAIPTLRSLAPIVRAHHERVDGHGYPDGLTDEEIPMEAKIISAADVYDAMTSVRSYSNGISPAEAVKRLKAVRGTQLDGQITDTLIALIRDEGDRLFVE